MSRPFIKSYVATADIAPYLIAKAAVPATGTTVSTAAAATDSLLGVTDSLGGVAGKAVDITLQGPAEVRLGGNVGFNDPLTADANGKAIVAVAGAGANKRIIGYALAPGALDDIIPIRVAPGYLANPAA
ncbi:hypothetical protein [Ancylobacter sp. TS-1]|uniref:hypothetical protein n=1 Tax=Ancylobacter sp. TS-1 TaxID=1850374 RepID=UPI001265D460|nr:hypothetical protein [Ancylobacter sp. TS-1]QFR32391.1 hypothetical protein GBB76_04260 [Ancylobacter sp. TS-1]